MGAEQERYRQQMSGWRTGRPAEAGYYLAAWQRGHPDAWTVSELWFNPDTGWWPSRGYLRQRADGDRPIGVVAAWMPMPVYETPEAAGCGHEPEGREIALDPASGIDIGDWITYRAAYPEQPDFRARVVRFDARNRGLVVVDEQPGMPLEHMVTWDRVVGKVK